MIADWWPRTGQKHKDWSKDWRQTKQCPHCGQRRQAVYEMGQRRFACASRYAPPPTAEDSDTARLLFIVLPLHKSPRKDTLNKPVMMMHPLSPPPSFVHLMSLFWCEVEPTWRIHLSSPDNISQTDAANWIRSKMFWPKKKEVQMPWPGCHSMSFYDILMRFSKCQFHLLLLLAPPKLHPLKLHRYHSCSLTLVNAEFHSTVMCLSKLQ